MIEALSKIAEVSPKGAEAKSTFDPDKKVEKNTLNDDNPKEEFNPDEKVEKDETSDVRNCPVEGNGGHWTGERGNSTWVPDDDYVPEKANPEGLTWKELKEKYGIEGIPFKDGSPDFSEISKGNVEIEGYSDSRPKNFAKADVELAKQRGCSPAEVREWREKNGYTWHESRDCKTMNKVPNDVHLNVPHRGGISTIKQGV
ncbi:MAG: HNH endonuclease [Spirochaetales bacterium]|nr:HNH endonuclease [Spirochaetales bacterium]